MIMTTTASKQYNGDTKVVRVPVRCPVRGRLMTRVSLTGEWGNDLKMWIWCRGCHAEHEITRDYIEAARAGLTE